MHISILLGTCKGLQKTHRVTIDGDYLLTVRGRKVQIYCHHMNSTNPQEYISLRGKYFRKILHEGSIFKYS